jgi:hypothetical protein
MSCAEQCRNASRQDGAATLAVTLMLLFSLGLMMLYTARVAVTEQRIAANDVHARTAFAAAQAGVDRVLAGLVELDRAAVTYDADGWSIVAARAESLPNGAAYSAEAHNRGLTPFAADVLRIEARGTAGDGGARRVTLLAAFDPLLPNVPPAPLLVRGELAPAGDLALENFIRPVAAWVGGAYVPGGVLDVQLSEPTSCPPDGICADDTRIGALTPEAFLANIFGREPDALRSAARVIECSPCDPSAMTPAGGVLWLENGGAGIMLDSGELGTEEHPVVAVVAGDLEIAGPLHINGLLVVLGDWAGGSAALIVEGALVVAGDVAGGGPAELRYHAGILDTLQRSGRYSAVPGSWSDL